MDEMENKGLEPMEEEHIPVTEEQDERQITEGAEQAVAEPLGEAAPPAAEEAPGAPQPVWQAPGTYRSGNADTSPFANSPYTHAAASVPQPDDPPVRSGQPLGDWSSAAYNNDPPPRQPKPARKRKKGGVLRVIATLLAFVLVGTTGGLLGAHLTNRRWETASRQLEKNLQSQIDGLRAQSEANAPAANENITVTPAYTGGSMSPRQVYDRNVPSVVSIVTQGFATDVWGPQEFVGSGSGFILTEDGYILTNYHVVEGGDTLTVTTYDGTEYPATLIGSDSFSDVALLKVEAENLPAVVIGDSDALSVGDQVAAIGNPLGQLASSQTVGYVSAKDRMVNTDGTILNMLQTDAAINSGNSGGPLFNMDGQVVGITTAKYSGSTPTGTTIEGIGFAIPINDVMDLVGDLMEYGYITGQAYLGVGLREMDAGVAAAYGLPAGPRVESVEEGSCADKAGVQVGDFITGLGEHTIESYSDLAYALRSFRAGDTTTISVFRAGAELTLTATLDEKPADTAVSQEQQTPQQQQPSGQMPDGSLEDWYNYLFPFFGQQP